MSREKWGVATWVCPWAWCKRNGGGEWCDKCELRVALAASQEKERQLTEALEQIADPSYVGNYKPDEVVAIYRKWAANTLDSTQTHGNEEWPEGWPDKCANCGADWTQISYDHALGFNCQSCGGSDADE